MEPTSNVYFRKPATSPRRWRRLLVLALLLCGEAARAQCDPPPPGIVGWWPGNGNTQDLAGGNTGTNEGTLTYGAGEAGQAFGVASDYGFVEIGSSPLLNVGTSAGLTVECWINPGDLTERPLVEWNNGGYGVHFWISVPLAGGGTGSIYANLVDTGNSSHYFSTAPGVVTTNTFQHVALTYDKTSGNATLYYNGAAATTVNLGVFTPQTSYNLYLGCRPGYTASAVPMLEDEVSIYSRALSAAEIQAIYNAGTNGKCASELPPVVVQSPQSVVVPTGGSAAFSADVNGASPLSYQWLLNGTNLPAATNATLNLSAVGLAQLGVYALAVSNLYGQLVSGNAFLSETGYDNCVSPASGLVDWWPAEGNALDMAGARNGVFVGGVGIADGYLGRGFVFDGSSGYVDLGAWNPGSTWTLEAWVNPSSLPSGQHCIFGDFANCADWAIVLYNGQFGVQSRQPGGCTQTTTSPLTVTPGTWYHVAGTCDGTNASIYVNGVFQASAAVQPNYVGDGTDVRIGSAVCCGYYFAGMIDEVSLYNRALADAEIAAIYAAGAEGKCAGFPRVASLTPDYNTTQVSTNVSVSVTFTLPMAADTLTTNTFVLSDLNQNPIPGIVSYDAPTRTASFTPNAPLAAASLYNAVVTTNVLGTNGSPLLGNIAWQFSTLGNTVFFLNNGTNITAAVTNYDGQNLFIENGTVTVSSGTHPFGTITVAGGGSLMLNGGTLKNATVNSINGGTCIVNGSGEFDGVTFNGLLDVGSTYDAAVLTVTNGLTLNGTAMVGNPSNYPRGIINFAGTQTLGGTGSVVFGQANGSYYNDELQASIPGTTLTIGPGFTIHGKNGVVGSGNGTAVSGPANVELVNLGTISCDVSGGAILVTAAPLLNSGKLGVNPGPGVNNGTLGMANGGSLSLNGLAKVSGLSVSGTGALTVNGAWQLIQPLTLSGATLNLAGTGTIGAPIGLTNSALNVSGSWTNAAVINATNSSVNLGGGFMLADLGVFNHSGGQVTLAGTLTNTAAPFVMDGATSNSWTLSGTILGGTILSTNGASLLISGGTILSATVVATNGGSFIVNGNGGLFDGLTFSGVLDVGSSYDAAQLTVTNGLTLNGTALVGNPSNYPRGILNFAGSQTLDGDGTVVFGQANGSYYNDELQASIAGTTLTIGAGVTIRGKNGVVGSGNGTAVSGPANVELVNLGTISCDVSGGTIVINGQPFINEGNLDAPSGALSLSGMDNLAGGAMTVGVSGPSSFGQINFGGNALLAGSIGVVLENGYQPALGASFAVVNYGSESGTFSSYSLPGSSLPWQVNYGFNQFTVTLAQPLVPVVNLISPTTGSLYQAPAVVGISATATTQSGTIATVNFYAGQTLLGTVTNSPYSLTWSNPPPGSYALTATATDTTGAVGTSSQKMITVLPTISGTNFTWVAGSGNWFTAGNWSPNGVPGPLDQANILNGATVTISANATVGYLNLASGTLNGGAILIVSNFFYWTGGVINTPLTIATNSTLIVAGGTGNNDVPSTVLTNYGTVEWASGTIRTGGCNGGTTVYNYGLWDAQSDQTFNDAYGCNNAEFINYGTFRKSEGNVNGSTLFASGVYFDQLAGAIDVQNGNNGLNLVFQSGGSFTGGYITTNTAGVTVLSAGNFTINGTVTPTNLIENAGNLVGANVISGGLTWQAGVWNGSTFVTILPNSTVIVAGGAGVNDFSSTVVANYGTVEWASGTMRAGGCNGGTTVYNYGLWDAQSDQTFNDAYGCNNAEFVNYGTFRKSGGTGGGYTLFSGGVYFDQMAGVVDVQNGTNGLTLVLQGSGSFTGGYITTNTAGVTVLSVGNFTINGTVTPTNLIENAGNLVGTNIITGGLTWQAGVWNNVASLTIAANSTVIIAGGAGVNDFASTVVTNYGTVNWSSGTIRTGGCNGGTTVYNYGLWDAQSDQTYNDAYGCNNSEFINYGTFRKSGGTAGGYTLFSGGVYFDQVAGVVDVESGTSGLTLVLQGSGSFTGGYLAANPAGITVLSAGNFTINGTVTPTNLIENAGNLVGGNVINGALTWQAGTWDSAAFVTIATNSLVIVAGGTGNNDMSSTVVTNYGTVAWASGTIRMGGCNGGTTIDNYGLWLAQSDQTLYNAFGCNGAVFNNAGTVRKLPTTGTSTFSVPFNNTGLLDVESGVVSLPAGNTLGAGSLAFGLSGPGNYGQLSVSGGVSLAGPLTVNLENGYVPAVSNSFTLLNCGSLSGTFSNLTLPFGASFWQVEYTNASVSLMVVDRHPAITQVSNQLSVVGQELVISNQVAVATPPASFSLGGSAPAGATLTSDGVFDWIPTCDEGGTSNLITIWVTDSSSPPLSNSMTFSVVVGDCVQLALGSTAMQVGATSGVPVTLVSSAGLTNLTWTLANPFNRFTNWVFASSNSAIARVSSSQTFFNLSTVGGQTLQSPALLGTLYFSALPGPSAFLSLAATNILGTETNGSVAGNHSSAPGRVVVVGSAPLLEPTLGLNSSRTLILYDNPGATYQLQVSTNLATSVWQTNASGTITNLMEYFPVNPTAPELFYRAQ